MVLGLLIIRMGCRRLPSELAVLVLVLIAVEVVAVLVELLALVASLV